ncbi:GNAT family N-acetyltransferase [Krasilnikovia sp. MM14-A1259]|uniref:GNAT family N-acetyltransferase n=1 Tax=Krasilnikovia sp. MM14-A1259 TaxID=3373539 RepID=UPI0037FAF4CF
MAAAVTAPPAGYLDDAADAGLLHHRAGLPYVAGVCTDVIGGERQYLIEYLDPALLAADPALDWLAAQAGAAQPAVDVLLLRTDSATAPGAPWERHLSYLRFVGPAGPPPAAVRVHAAGPEHDTLVRDWLVEAMTESAAERRRTGDPADLRALADTMLAQPGRRSYLAVHEGRTIGHLTLCPDRHDDVTGRRYTELTDVFVAPAELRRTAITALIAATVAALPAGELCIGQVAHPLSEVDPDKGGRILSVLLATGWAHDHTFWRRTP